MKEILVVVERHIAAPPETIFGYMVDENRWLQWQGTEADIDPTPGGIHRVNLRGDGFASGNYVEIVPFRKVSFTWGFEDPNSPIQPGTTLVEIELIPDEQGTLLRLSHSKIPGGSDSIEEGWNHFLDRLLVVSEGRDPGHDPHRIG